jgi:hypothetical protein
MAQKTGRRGLEQVVVNVMITGRRNIRGDLGAVKQTPA